MLSLAQGCYNYKTQNFHISHEQTSNDYIWSFVLEKHPQMITSICISSMSCMFLMLLLNLICMNQTNKTWRRFMNYPPIYDHGSSGMINWFKHDNLDMFKWMIFIVI